MVHTVRSIKLCCFLCKCWLNLCWKVNKPNRVASNQKNWWLELWFFLFSYFWWFLSSDLFHARMYYTPRREKHHSQAKDQVKPSLHMQVKTQMKGEEKHLVLGSDTTLLKSKLIHKLHHKNTGDFKNSPLISHLNKAATTQHHPWCPWLWIFHWCIKYQFLSQSPAHVETATEH